MSRAPSLDASTPVSSANLRLSSSLGRLGNSDLQSELFESLLRLPPTTEPIPQSEPLLPPDNTTVASSDSSSENPLNLDQDQNEESDTTIQITDSTTWVNPPPQIAICYDRQNCHSKATSLPDSSDETPSGNLDLTSLNPNASPALPTNTFQPATTNQAETQASTESPDLAPEPPRSSLTDGKPNPIGSNPVAAQNPKPLPQNSAIRSGRAPTSDDAESPHPQGAIPSGRAPVDHSGHPAPSTSSVPSRDSSDPLAKTESNPQDPSRPEPIRDPRAIRLEEQSNQHPEPDRQNQDPNSLPEPNPTANQESLTPFDPIQAFDSHPTPDQTVQPTSAIDPTAASQNAANVPTSSAAATAAASTASTIAPTIDSNTTNSSQSNALASVGSVKGSANTTNASAATREPSPGNGSLSPRQETRLIQRVLRGFEQISEGEGQIKLRLHPPELGSLQISLKFEGEQLIAHLEVENALAKDALTQNISALRERLGEQGLRLERFDVQIVSEQNGSASSNGDTNSGWAGQTSQQRQDPNGRYRPAAWNPDRPLRESDRAPEETPRARRIVPGRGIDLTA